MAFDHPLTFRPLFMERVWGGRRLATELGKPIPAGSVIGESWEIVDRADAQSVVDSGPHAGTSLHELWTRHRREVFGDVAETPRFPLLAKILDARDTMSVQVHPPASLAAELHGEPKTELWLLLDAEPGAEMFAGFRRGTTREAFHAALAEGRVADLLHRVPVGRGDAMFIPSGRCHAIGAGCLVVEIQQNSDTTYRVFDWNRTGLDGKPRALHVPESLKSIDFSDHEPSLVPPDAATLADCEHFRVERWHLDAPRTDDRTGSAIFTVLDGAVGCGGREFKVGEFFLLPAAAEDRTLLPLGEGAVVMRTTF